MWSTSTYLIDHNQFIIFTMFLSSCATLTPPPTCKKNTKQSLSNEKGCLCLNFPFFLSENPMDVFSNQKTCWGICRPFDAKGNKIFKRIFSQIAGWMMVKKLLWGSNPWTKKNPSTQQIQAADQKNTHLPDDQPSQPEAGPPTFDETFQLLVGTKKKLGNDGDSQKSAA